MSKMQSGGRIKKSRETKAFISQWLYDNMNCFLFTEYIIIIL